MKRLFKKMGHCKKVHLKVQEHFLKQAEDNFPIVPQTKTIRNPNTEFEDGDIDFNEIDGDAQDGQIDLDQDLIKLFGFNN